MTTLDDLRDTFDTHTGTAPDVDLTVLAARAGATRIRRRRRVAVACVAAALVAVVAAVPSAVAGLRKDGPAPAAEPAYRRPGQLSLSVAPSTDYFVLDHGADGHRQSLLIRGLSAASGNLTATVFVYDPGTYDATALARGKRVTVNGHPAFQVTSLPGGVSPPAKAPYLAEAIGWQDDSGAWIVVTGADKAEYLTTLAAAVRLGPPSSASGPVGFGWVPGDLPLSYVVNKEADPHPHGYVYTATLGFGAGTPIGRYDEFTGPGTRPLSVSVLPVENRGFGENNSAEGGDWQTINGYQVRFVTDRGSQAFPDGPGGHVLVSNGSCGVTIAVTDLTEIPFAQVQKMIGRMTVRSCTDLSTWGPVLTQ
jgi:hypothetical protein